MNGCFPNLISKHFKLDMLHQFCTHYIGLVYYIFVFFFNVAVCDEINFKGAAVHLADFKERSWIGPISTGVFEQSFFSLYVTGMKPKV